PEATALHQADASTAIDLAWDGSGAGRVAWDEDAPPSADAAPPSKAGTYAPEGRGFVKVQALGSGARRVASPESSDAESPRLLPRAEGGFWLAWLARRAEASGYAVESPGEHRAFRWVEVVALTATGEAAGPVRRISSEKGRVASFELAQSGSSLVVLAQDEAASAEGAGAHIIRYVVGEGVDATNVVDGGIGQALAELVPAPTSGTPARWLSWTDTAERSHLAPLENGFLAMARPTTEPSLDGARVLASTGADTIFALVEASPAESAAREGGSRFELRRFACPPTPAEQASPGDGQK
ncbi:MAG TPA: hypothetical protein VM580_13440, partial [Labilithrix sp.]|nr:hypothetical protein [Labilithrix sp.]